MTDVRDDAPAHHQNGQRDGGRVPPHNLEAEESLLGAMLLSKHAVDAVLDRGLTGADFYRPAHGHIYDVAVHLHDHGDPVDPVTVAAELGRRNLLEQVGGSNALVGIQARTPATSSAGHYAKVVGDHAVLRRLIGVAGEIAELGYSLPDDVTRAIEHADQLLADATSSTVGATGTARTLHDGLDDYLTLLEHRCEGTVPAGVTTGLHDLDTIIGGALPGQMICVAGRPGMGKTAMGLTFARNAAHSGAVTLFVSVEMGETELYDRLVAAEAHLPQASLRGGKIAANDWPRVSHAIGRLAELPLVVYDDPAATVTRIANRARRTRGLGVIILDYLQLVTSTAKAENRQAEVADLSRQLKRLARELRVPVIPLAQLNRNLEGRADKRPQLSDLRETGQIEQDSDVVIGLYRDEVYNPDTRARGVLEAIVLKQRNGPLGVAKVAFNAETQRIRDLAKDSM